MEHVHRDGLRGHGATEPHPNLRAYWEPITSVTAINDDTVEFKLEPLITMLGLLLTEGVGDSVVNKETLEAHGELENWEHALGSGPFLLTEVVEGTSYTWEKNPNWWGEDPRYPGNQLPYIEEMEWGVYWSRMGDGELEEWHWDNSGPQGSPIPRLTGFFTSDAPYYKKFWNDPVIDEGVEKALAATDMEEYTNIINDVADHIRDQQYRVLFPLMANVAMWHPYVEGFNGEWYSGVCNTGYVYAHVWLDPDKKTAMGY